YCTGDLHIGSNDVVYTHPTTSVATTFRHRGFDNVLSVVNDIRTRYGFVDQILVTGQSAGGYGAIFNFPVIKESFPSARVDVLADASNGVLPSAAAQIQTLRAQYGLPANLPTWMTNTATPLSQARLTSGALQVRDYFAEAAATYPTSRVAQYTSMYDGNQRFFYGVMQTIQAGTTYTDARTQDPRVSGRRYSTLYGDSDGTAMADADSCAWRDGAASAMKSVADASTNYTYFVAPGDVHTITTSDDMHTVVSGGQNFVQWLREFTGDGGIPARRQCSAAGCNAPVSDASTPGIVSANCGAAETTLF
ncbi:MAG: pectin acetylesterase-family hydrolase, partial [Leptospirales bacterium]